MRCLIATLAFAAIIGLAMVTSYQPGTGLERLITQQVAR